MLNLSASAGEAKDTINGITDTRERLRVILTAVRSLPVGNGSLSSFENALELIKEIEYFDERRAALEEFISEIPLNEDYFDLYKEAVKAAISATLETEEPKLRKTTLNQIAAKIPQMPALRDLFIEITNLAIVAANEIEKPFTRRFSLASIAKELPKDPEYIPLRERAYSLALGLSEEDINKVSSLEEIAHELPKSCDYQFYRDNAFFGIAQQMPKIEAFLPLYLRAVARAVEATTVIDEPYYKKYALIYITKELPETEYFLSLHKEIMGKTLDATLLIEDQFVKHFALLEMLHDFPKTPEFYPLILRTMEELLPFFSIKSRLDDVELIEVIDYIIIAEERKINEGKKNRYTRENYATKFTKELSEFGPKLTDIRFLDVLKPYTHIWVRPNHLRETVRKVVNQLEQLRDHYHGSEILRPAITAEEFDHTKKDYTVATDEESKKRTAGVTVSIDLGATNTVVMMKKPGSDPFYVTLKNISKTIGDIETVPTLYSETAGSIGTEAITSDPVTNLKKMLLDNKEDGRRLMESYFRILYGHIKRELSTGGWLKSFTGLPADNVYITVPVGFEEYRSAIRAIAAKTVKGAKAEFIEEPLAAAIGYQVAEKRDKIVMVIDFGGCTLDVMVLRLNVDTVHVVAKPDRSEMLGGRDIDEWLAASFAKTIGLASDLDSLPASLITKAEEVKIALSGAEEATLEWEGREGVRIDLEEFEKILDSRDFYSIVDRGVSFVLKKSKKIGIPEDKIEAVILTGGSSQIPSFKEKVDSLFPRLHAANAIFDHSPLSAVATGAALYGTSEVTDRHLAVACGLRHVLVNSENHYGFELIFEKGDPLPFEKTFRLTPAKTLGGQKEIFLELFEIPDSLITRRWVSEAGHEYIKQVIKKGPLVQLKAMKVITLSFDEDIEGTVSVTFIIDQFGHLTVRYNDKDEETGIRLQ
ncbi:MAG: Hsp70 family protein [Thermodesulfobacteriota bacterium]